MDRFTYSDGSMTERHCIACGAEHERDLAVCRDCCHYCDGTGGDCRPCGGIGVLMRPCGCEAGASGVKLQAAYMGFTVHCEACYDGEPLSWGASKRAAIEDWNEKRRAD